MTPDGVAPRRSLDDLVGSYEEGLIVRAIERSGGSRTGAAELLGVRRSRLYQRIASLGSDVLARFPRRAGRPRGEVT